MSLGGGFSKKGWKDLFGIDLDMHKDFKQCEYCWRITDKFTKQLDWRCKSNRKRKIYRCDSPFCAGNRADETIKRISDEWNEELKIILDSYSYQV